MRSCGIDPATGREIFLTKEGKQTFVHDYDDEMVVGNSDPDVEGCDRYIFLLQRIFGFH